MSIPQDRPWTAGIWAKLNRAEHHLTDIDTRVGEYFDRQPYEIVPKQNPDGVVEFVWRFTEMPPIQLSTVIGDCVQNMRAALDHLAWQLVNAHGLVPSVNPPRTQFPIYTSSVNQNRNPRVVDIPPGIDPRAQVLIERYQPYHRRDNPDAHPLAMLQELSNEDKHRTIHLIAGRAVGSQVDLVTHTGYRIPITGDAGIVHHEEPIGILRLPPGMTEIPGDWEIQGMGSTFVGFLETDPFGDRPVVHVLDEILEYIRYVVMGGLQPFMEKALEVWKARPVKPGGV